MYEDFFGLGSSDTTQLYIHAFELYLVMEIIFDSVNSSFIIWIHNFNMWFINLQISQSEDEFPMDIWSYFLIVIFCIKLFLSAFVLKYTIKLNLDWMVILYCILKLL